jgi:hypothetical protein
LRIYRSLATLVGDDDAKARLWLTHENAHLHRVPLELMADVSTLGEVLVYLVRVHDPERDRLWALANYFKHRDEWEHSDWAAFTGQRKDTVDVLQQVGLEPGSTGNLRKAAKIFGNAEFVDVDRFADVIDEWSAVVLVACRKELGLK